MWTQEEIESLRQMYSDPAVSKATMEQYFRRLWGAINMKARRLGLERLRQGSWSGQEIADLRRMYPNTSISVEQLIGYFGRSKYAIIAMAYEFDIKRRNVQLKPWSQEETARLREMYSNKKINTQQMQQMFGRTANAITKQAGILGLMRYDHQIKHSYFAEITTDEQAYWMGWLASDGSVKVSTLGGTYISLELQARDEAIVRASGQAVAPGATMHRNRNAVSVRIGSKRMAEDLAVYGIVPNKTKIFDWPRVMPEAFSIPFILGYFDGDGCLYQNANASQNNWSWYLLGTQPFLNAAQQRIELYADVILRKPIRADKHRCPFLYKLSTGNKEIIRRIDATINASELGLPRKHL